MILAASRVFQTELMDGTDYDASEYATTLRELATINRLTAGYRPTLLALRRFARLKTDGSPLRILDVGCAGGDTLREIEAWAHAENIPVELTGIDINSQAVALAREWTSKSSKIQFVSGDLFDYQASGAVDVIINALFMHHLDDAQIVQCLKWMTANGKLGWFINDLHRHAIAYHFIKHATRLARFNRLIRHDAPVSVARAFTKAEWCEYLQAADIPLERVTINWHLPFRYGVLCRNENFVPAVLR